MKKTRVLALALLLVFVLSQTVGAIEKIDIDAKGAILINAADGHMLYGKNETGKCYPASVTKLMTALLVVENITDLSEKVTAKESAFSDLSEAGSSVDIKVGETMSVDNLLICMLVASANEAANILAERVVGSVQGFVEQMNSRAAELGLAGTHFVNAHGLHDDNHYTTAADMAVIAREVHKHARLREICAMDKATIAATEKSSERFFYTTNSLISRYKELPYIYSRANGMKTGSTTPAGLCLVASAEKNDLELISVVLGARKNEETGMKGNFVESKRLLEWGFENFRERTLLSASQPVSEIKVELARERDYVVACLAEDYRVLMPTDYDESKLVLTPSAETVLKAPIKKGDEVGSVTVSYDGRDYAELPLVAADDVERSTLLYVYSIVKSFFGNPITVTVIIAAVVALLLYILFVIRYNKRRNKRRRRRRYR